MAAANERVLSMLMNESLVWMVVSWIANLKSSSVNKILFFYGALKAEKEARKID